MSDIKDFSDSDLFLNRELSQLEFNFRVLAQARDPMIPLLERLKYLVWHPRNIPPQRWCCRLKRWRIPSRQRRQNSSS